MGVYIAIARFFEFLPIAVRRSLSVCPLSVLGFPSVLPLCPDTHHLYLTACYDGKSGSRYRKAYENGQEEVPAGPQGRHTREGEEGTTSGRQVYSREG